MAWWEDASQVLAGRDLEAGGSWLGITRGGRFAALTNYRDPSRHQLEAPSRGRLVSRFLTSLVSAEEAAAELVDQGAEYNGFNMVVGDGRELWYAGNRGARPVRLDRGIYALSNHLLDSPWPKVVRLKAGLKGALGQSGPLTPEGFRHLLEDRHLPEDAELPDTGVGLELERLLAPACIVSPDYGTRSSTVIMVGASGQVELVEWSRGRDGRVRSEVRHGFRIDAI
jgi:uncharacterized protein with NRDE domain